MGRNAGLGHNETLLNPLLQRRQGTLNDKAWSSLTLFTVVMVKRNAFLNDSHLILGSRIYNII